MTDQVDPGLTEAEAIALLRAHEINVFPTETIDGEDASEVLERAEAKLRAALPESFEDRIGNWSSGKSIAELQLEINEARAAQIKARTQL